MPDLPLRPCPRPGCPAVVRGGGYCERHKPAPWRHERSAAARGYDRRWRRTRALILGHLPLCRLCEAAGITRLAAELDHIVPKAAGGSDDPTNLQPLCRAHHRAKTRADAAAARAEGQGGE